MKYLLLIILIGAFLFPNSLISKKTIIWNNVGQKEVITKDLDFDMIYGQANPENTRIQLKSSAKEGEFVLELVKYEPPSRSSKSSEISSSVSNEELKKLELQIEELRQANKTSLDIIEQDKKFNERLKETSEKKKTDINEVENFEDVKLALKEKIKNIDTQITDKEQEIQNNNDIIKETQIKILELGDSDQDKRKKEEYNSLIKKIEAQNRYLEKEIKLLAVDKQLLTADLDLIKVELERQKQLTYFLMLIAGIVLLFAIILYFRFRLERRLKNIIDAEKKESERLLLNILPLKIANRLKQNEHSIADYFDTASIVFIDLAGFTNYSSSRKPGEIVEMLDAIFKHLDSLADKYHLEKIKTIGDAYMAASGIPEKNEKHAINAAMFAIEANNYFNKNTSDEGNAIKARIGIGSGDVVAGVIGTRKFAYDLWGDAVNTASRMESSGVVGKIQINEKFRDELLSQMNGSKINIEERGEIEIKGKGKLKTFFIND